MAGDEGGTEDAPFRRVPPWWTDPTENVKVLVEAATGRLDDLRAAESRHVRELISRDREFATAMRLAETERINAIRAVDVGAVQRAAEVQAGQANTLAAQVTATADAFRASMAAALAPIQASIEDLRRAQYEAQGKQGQVLETREVRADTRQGATLNLTAISVLIGALVVALTLYAAVHK